MDQVFYWLDRGGWISMPQYSWIWASVTAVLAVGALAGIAALARRYDGRDGARGQWARDA